MRKQKTDPEEPLAVIAEAIDDGFYPASVDADLRLVALARHEPTCTRQEWIEPHGQTSRSTSSRFSTTTSESSVQAEQRQLY